MSNNGRFHSLSRGGFSAWPILILIVAMGFLAILRTCVSYSGGDPHSLHLIPPSLVLVVNVPKTVDVQLVLHHPLPNPTIPSKKQVDIDEDDAIWDDDLYHSVTVTFASGNTYSHGTFDLICRNLQPNGTFDLHGDPSADISVGEIVHEVHAEGPGDNSKNMLVTCVPPPVGGDEDEGGDEEVIHDVGG